MTRVDHQQSNAGSERPLVEPDWLTEPFWCAGEKNELRIQRCCVCEAWFYPPQVACPQCLEEAWEWLPTSGRGTVYSFTVVHRPASPAFEGPYVLAIIELDEGPAVMANIVGGAPDAVRIGAPVAVAFDVAGNGTAVPVFRPVSDPLT